MSTSPTNHGASVRARLLTRARANNENYNNLLQRYAAERFLYRLGVSSHRHEYVLKGAMLFGLWGGSVYRPTKDLDFTGYGASDADTLAENIREICAIEFVEDGVQFETGALRIAPIREDVEYGGVRITFVAMIGGARVPMQIDVGFANAIHPGATDSDYPQLLSTLPAAHIRAYPQEAVVAEKFHAMVVLGERNSRFKDFYDLYVLASRFEFDGELLAGAISSTFERRGTLIADTIPGALTARFYNDAARAARWLGYVARDKLPGAPSDFAQVGELLVSFIGPVHESLRRKAAAPNRWTYELRWPKPDADKDVENES